MGSGVPNGEVRERSVQKEKGGKGQMPPRLLDKALMICILHTYLKSYTIHIIYTDRYAPTRAS